MKVICPVSYLLIGIFFFSFVFGTYAQDEIVKVNVKTTPSSSFEIISKTFRGGKVNKASLGYKIEKMIIPVDSLTSGIDLRDQHLQKYLGIEVLLHEAYGIGGKGQGKIEINKIIKDFDFTYTQNGKKHLDIKFLLKLSDFDIKEVSYMGVSVQDELRLEATLSFL